MLWSVISQLEKIVFDKYQVPVKIERSKKGNSHLSLPLFSLSSQLKVQIQDLYNQISIDIENNPFVEKSSLDGGFLNIYLKKQYFVNSYLHDKLPLVDNYQTIVVDFSSPNIAKNFSVGHVRSTVIGNSLVLINKYLGHKVIGINYLGDWGTQFGKVLYAFQNWRDDKLYLENPSKELQRVYQLFHARAEEDTSLEEVARETFKKLEDGDQESLKLWTQFRKDSVKDFKKLYSFLKVKFDVFSGESLYNDKIIGIVELLKEKELLVEDQGAHVVLLEDSIPAMILKSNGTSTYLARDLAAIIDRYDEYQFDKILYVVGNEQKLHFNQLSALVHKLGYKFELIHVPFGMVLENGKKMSSREGKVITLQSILDSSIEEAKKILDDRKDNVEDKDKITSLISVGSVIYNDLKNERILDINYDFSQMLRFDGNTGPYLQYTLARILSILSQMKVNKAGKDLTLFENDDYFNLILLCDELKISIIRASQTYEPSIIAKHLFKICKEFNSFYAKYKMNVDDINIQSINYLLLKQLEKSLKLGLKLLGISFLKKM